MPSFNVRDNVTMRFPAEKAYVPVIYNGKLYVLQFHAGGSRIFNVDDGTEFVASETDDPNKQSTITRLIDFKAVTKSTFMMRGLHIRSGTLIVDKLEFDLDAQTITREEEATFSLDFISRWEDMAHSIVIPPRLWVAPDFDSGLVYLVDLDTGESSSFDTGYSGGYNVNLSPKYIHYRDDIWMHAGRHYAGGDHKIIKLYSGTKVDTGITTGGGSARAQIGNMSWFYNDIIIPAGSGGVNNQDNDIKLLDARFNVKATIDLGALTGWANNDPLLFGINIFAKARDGSKYYAILGVGRQTSSGTDNAKIFYLELDNTLNVTTSQLLIETGAGNSQLNCGRDYSDFFCRPILVVPRKKLYAIGVKNADYGLVIEVDLSDIWDNVEFNKNLWILGGKIPTQLTLQITPL